MKKKILILTLCIALLAVAAVGGTLAYFTDTEEVTNTFTVGNVKIELLESQLLRAEGITDEAIAADAEGYAAYLAQAGKNILPGISVKKAPYIRNTGSKHRSCSDFLGTSQKMHNSHRKKQHVKHH